MGSLSLNLVFKPRIMRFQNILFRDIVLTEENIMKNFYELNRNVGYQSLKTIYFEKYYVQEILQLIQNTKKNTMT